MSVGLIAALPAEVRCLVSSRPALNLPIIVNPHLTVMVCGIGAEHARSAAQRLLQLRIQALISWGTAGALSPQLHPGDLLLPEKILNRNGKTMTADTAWLRRIRQSLPQSILTLHSGVLTETREILGSVAQKRELHARTGAIAADMESAAIMETAASAGIPGIVIRSVVDDAGTTLPEGVLQHIDNLGRMDLAGLIIEICRSPRLLGTLWRLGCAMRRATATLRSVARHHDAILMYGAD